MLPPLLPTPIPTALLEAELLEVYPPWDEVFPESVPLGI